MKLNKDKTHELLYFSDQLKKQLAKIEKFPLTIVEAPSGFGKTTAIREYLKEKLSKGGYEKWYTCLGESSAKVWNGICNLFSQVAPETASRLEKLEFPTEEMLADLVSIIRTCRVQTKIFLVIDNYQLVSSEIPRDIIHAFSVHGDPKLHLIFVTQPLKDNSKYTVHYQHIHKIQNSDLTLNKKGTDKYFKMAGIKLSDSELDNLYNFSEGWISAISLQLLNYRQTGTFARTADIEKLVHTAIWNRLDDSEKEILLSLSTLDSFTSKQIRIMIGQSVLNENVINLINENAFIRYDSEKDLYNMHSILQDYLRAWFYNNTHENFQIKTIKRAGEACISEALLYPAAQFYYKIKDFDSILSMTYRNEYLDNQKEQYVIEFILKIIDECPAEIMNQYPFAMLEFAFQLFLGGRRDVFGKMVQMLSAFITNPKGIEREQFDRIKGEMSLLMSFAQYNDIEKMSEYHKKALEYLKGASKLFFPTTPWTFGGVSVLYMFWSKVSELETELKLMDECIPIYGQVVSGHGTSANIVMRAEAMLLRGNDDDAERLCHKAIFMAKDQNQTGLCICSELLLARISLLRGDTKAYLAAVGNIQEYAVKRPERFIVRMVELGMSTLSLIRQNTDEVADWLNDPDYIKKILFMPTVPYGHILFAKKLMLSKRYNELHGLSGAMMSMAEGMNYLLPQVYHLIFLAISSLVRQNKQEAKKYVCRALNLALPDKIYMPFAEHAEELVPFLESVRFDASDEQGIKHIIQLSKRQKKGVDEINKALITSKSSLTPREREIALLAKERLSAKEIAETLFLAESTVRSVLKSIYSKLNIHSKKELSNIDF